MLQAKLDAPFKEYSEHYAHSIHSGQVVPDFMLKDINGNLYTLSKICRTSSLTLIGAIHLYQEISMRQLIDFREAYDDLHHKGLSVLTLTDESLENVSKLIHRYKIPFPLLLDPDGSSFIRFGTNQQIYGALIGPDRKALFVALGYRKRMHINALVDKAFLTLTDREADRPLEDPTPLFPTFSREHPLMLSDLRGNSVSLPFTETTAIFTLSTECMSCESSYRYFADIFHSGHLPVKVVLLFIDTIQQVSEWLNNYRKEMLPGVQILIDPTDLFRSKVVRHRFGSLYLVNRRGTVLGTVDTIFRPDSKAKILRLLTKKGK